MIWTSKRRLGNADIPSGTISRGGLRSGNASASGVLATESVWIQLGNYAFVPHIAFRANDGITQLTEAEAADVHVGAEDAGGIGGTPTTDPSTAGFRITNTLPRDVRYGVSWRLLTNN